MALTKEMIADLVINIANIVVLFVIVRFLAYKPVKKFLDARSTRAVAEKEKALAMQAEAEKKSLEYDALLVESQKAREEAVKAGELEARRESQILVDEAREKAAKIIADADAKAKERTEKMMDDAKDDVVNLVYTMSEKLLSREVTDADNRRIVEDFLKDFGKSGDKND